LTYHYPEAAAAALTDITVNIDEGEFVLLLGASGSGKSTFLRALNGLVPRFYGGRIGGKVHYRLTELAQLTQREIVKNLGFLHQDPERQIVLDTVEREVAFGMENIGLPMAQMKSRLAEVSQLFGLGPLLHKRTAEVSGGEKQRIALAGLLALYPHVLLLDEPTSQLDPVHAEEVLQSLRRLHEEWGFTIVMSEHRLDRTFHLADRILFFDQGRLVFDGTPLAFAQAAAKSEPEWQAFLSPITRHMLEKTNGSALPITVKEARSILRRVSGDGCLASSDDVNLLRADRRRQAGSLPLIQIEKAKAGYEGNDNV
ncbi:energy-coupling factor ABC transporter ATP-binding protein, partial [Microbacteriaceae bacterium K1510]|nr:energy-coupling factor ABC transporter ATP-binding protein [Microbacteriaceae bacterium K1510]